METYRIKKETAKKYCSKTAELYGWTKFRIRRLHEKTLLLEGYYSETWSPLEHMGEKKAIKLLKFQGEKL